MFVFGFRSKMCKSVVNTNENFVAINLLPHPCADSWTQFFTDVAHTIWGSQACITSTLTSELKASARLRRLMRKEPEQQTGTCRFARCAWLLSSIIHRRCKHMYAPGLWVHSNAPPGPICPYRPLPWELPTSSRSPRRVDASALNSPPRPAGAVQRR